MPVDIPPSILAPILQLGFAGVVIVFLGLAVYRLQAAFVEAQEARVAEQKSHAADILKSIEALDRLTRAVREQHEASEQRWRITESVVEVVRGTAKGVDLAVGEITRIGRLVDANTIRIENIEKRHRS